MRSVNVCMMSPEKILRSISAVALAAVTVLSTAVVPAAAIVPATSVDPATAVVPAGSVNADVLSGSPQDSLPLSESQPILPGDYMIVLDAPEEKDHYWYLDIEGSASPADSGTNVGIHQASADWIPDEYDVWTVTNWGGGYYMISQKGTTMNLEIENGSTDAGANARIWHRTSNDQQLWTITPNGFGGYRLKPRSSSNSSLDLAGAGLRNDGNVWQYDDNDTFAQSWLFIPYKPAQEVDNGRYVFIQDKYIKTHMREVGLTVPGNMNTATSPRVGISDLPINTPNNSFDVTKLENGYYKIIHHASGKAVSSGLNSGSGFDQVFLEDYTGGLHQQWNLAYDGYVNNLIVKCRLNGLVIETFSSSDSVALSYHQKDPSKSWNVFPAEQKITYDPNGGKGGPKSPEYHTYGTKATVSMTKPVRDGYAFSGWSSYPDAVNAYYQPGSPIESLLDLKLYAVWYEIVATGIHVPDRAYATVGLSSDLGASLIPDNANGKLLCTSSKEDIVTITSKGKAYGQKVGNATITVKSSDGRFQKTFPITVEFKDVKKTDNSYYYDAVYWAAKQGITAGVKNNKTGLFDTFDPRGNCTRAQMVTFLWRMGGCPEPSKKADFSDIDPKAYYYKAVCWAQERGITGGYTDGTFRPQGLCTRAQAAAFLWRFHGMPEPKNSKSSFNDVKDKKTYYYKAVLWADEQNIAKGYSDSTFRPENTCSRSQMVTFLYRARN